MHPFTIGVLTSLGSTSSGRDLRDGVLDLTSGADLLESLGALGYRTRLVHVTDDLDGSLRQAGVDACLLALHGTVGGSGEIQSLLALRGIPYAGPPAAAVALAFDKVRARQLLAYHNLPVPAAVALSAHTRVADRALGLLGWPCVLKPRRGAQGVGLSVLSEPEQVQTAVEGALEVDEELVLERAVDGIEIQVVLLGDRVLGSMQVERGGPVQDALTPCQMMCPPQVSSARLLGIQNLARRAVESLGLHDGLSRVDVLLSPRGNEVILEVEPLPPLHRDGVVARVALAAGLRHEHLVAELLQRISMGALVRPRTEASSSLVLQ